MTARIASPVGSRSSSGISTKPECRCPCRPPSRMSAATAMLERTMSRSTIPISRGTGPAPDARLRRLQGRHRPAGRDRHGRPRRRCPSEKRLSTQPHQHQRRRQQRIGKETAHSRASPSWHPRRAQHALDVDLRPMQRRRRGLHVPHHRPRLDGRSPRSRARSATTGAISTSSTAAPPPRRHPEGLDADAQSWRSAPRAPRG